MRAPEVVVLGAGVVGCATAYFLAREGVSALVVERDALGSHASGFAFGGLAAYSGFGIPGPVYPLAREAMRLHVELAERLPGEAGVDLQFRWVPLLAAADTEERALAFRRALSWLREEGFSASWVDGEAVRREEPRLAPSVLGGLRVEETALLESYRLTLALAQAAERAGVRFRHGRAVGLLTSGGRLEGVLLEGGERIPCDRLVVALGPWTGPAGAWLGLDLPVRPLKGQIVRVRLPGPPLPFYLTHEGNYCATKPDGLLWCGTTEEDVGFDERPTPDARDAILTGLARVLPALAEAEIVQQTACLRPLSGDGYPILGLHPDLEGVVLATGAGRKGILLGPLMGRLACELVLRGRVEGLDISPFDPARFRAGAPRGGPEHLGGVLVD